jgi:hypothetical protein
MADAVANDEHVNLRMPAAMRDEVLKLAEVNSRSMAEEIRAAVAAWLAQR